jgi:hypothetical protein
MLTTALAARPMLRLLGWVMMIQRQKYPNPPPPRQNAKCKTQSAQLTQICPLHSPINSSPIRNPRCHRAFFPQAALRLRAWLVAGGGGLCGAVTELSATAGATLAEGRTVLRGQVCADDALVRTRTLCDSTYVRSSSDSA